MLKENTKMKIIAKTLALGSACILLTVALAQAESMRPRSSGMKFKSMDTNKDGSLSQEEFMAPGKMRFAKTDADGDGIITEEELVQRIMRRRAERMAKRLIKRMDYDGDGKVTRQEVENRSRKRFLLLDGNDDGKLNKAEMRRNGAHRSGQRKQRRYGQRRQMSE